MKRLLFLTAFAVLVGCTPLQPGADPLVVRAEQIESGAYSTFVTFLTIDDQNREFFKTNAPAVHNFAEYLRTPVVIDATNQCPRDLAFILSLNVVKQSYKTGRASSNDVVNAITTLESALNQTKLYVSTTPTNH